MGVRHTRRLLLVGATLCFFAEMAQQLLAAKMVMVSATSLRWRRVRHTRRLLLVGTTRCFFAAMAQQLLAAKMVMVSATSPHQRTMCALCRYRYRRLTSSCSFSSKQLKRPLRQSAVI